MIAMTLRNTILTSSDEEEELLPSGRRRTESHFKFLCKVTPNFYVSLCSDNHDDDKSSAVDTTDDCWGWVVAFAAFIIWFLVSITTQCFGLLFLGFLTELKTSSTVVGWIYSLVFVLSCFLSYFLEPLVNKYGWRLIAFALGISNGLGLALSAFATSASFLFFSYSLLAGVAVEMLFNLTYSIIPQCLTRRRGLATNLMVSGTPVNMLLMPSLIEYLLTSYGFRGAVLIAAGLALNICVAAMVIHPVERHKTAANAPKPEIRTINSIEEGNASVLDSLLTVICASKKNLRLVRSPSVVITCTVFAIIYPAVFSVTNVIPFAMDSEGYFLEDISLCVTMQGVGLFTSRILHSILESMCGLGSQAFLISGCVIMTTALTGFLLAKNVVLKATILLIFGYGIGFISSSQNILILEEFGEDMVLPVFSILGLFSGITYLIIGPFIGMIRDLTQSYTVSLSLLAGLFITCIPLWACMPAARAYDRKHQQLREEEKENETQKQQHQQLREEKLWLASQEKLSLLRDKRESYHGSP